MRKNKPTSGTYCSPRHQLSQCLPPKGSKVCTTHLRTSENDPGYRFTTNVITIGALGTVPKTLAASLENLLTNKDRIPIVVQRIERSALIGTLKVCKTALKM